MASFVLTAHIMNPIDRRTFLKTVPAFATLPPSLFELRRTSRRGGQPQTAATPFGQDFPQLDAQTTGQWWEAPASKVPQVIELNVPRDRVVAFALYLHDAGVLKLTAQLYPLFPDEVREARLEVQRDGAWKEIARAPVEYPGWSAHFRVDRWDSSTAAPYRVRHGEKATFDGTIRRDPVDKDEIVVGNQIGRA